MLILRTETSLFSLTECWLKKGWYRKWVLCGAFIPPIPIISPSPPALREAYSALDLSLPSYLILSCILLLRRNLKRYCYHSDSNVRKEISCMNCPQRHYTFRERSFDLMRVFKEGVVCVFSRLNLTPFCLLGYRFQPLETAHWSLFYLLKCSSTCTVLTM